MQALIAHRPTDDLAHAVHLVVPRKVQQHRETGEQRHALRESPEHGESAGHVGDRSDAECVHVVGLGAHRLVFAEGGEFRLRHAEGFQQQGVGVDMNRLHVGEGGHHHLDFKRLEIAEYNA